MLEIIKVLGELNEIDPGLSFGQVIRGALLHNEDISSISNEKMLHDLLLYKCMLQKAMQSSPNLYMSSLSTVV